MIKLADGRGNLYQWDTGRQVECDAEQVHFSNHHYGTSIDVDVQNGKATIPNQLLTSATPLKAWAWVTDANGEYTKEEQVFLVAKRNKPSDYVYTPTELKTWQDLQNQIGDLNNLTTAHKDNLVNAINDAAGSGTSDFIIKMTLASDDEGNYTVASCDATIEQIDAAVADEKRVVVIASDGNDFFELPMLQGAQGITYQFGTFLNGLMIDSLVDKIDGNTSEWRFFIIHIGAESVDYSNDALPRVTNVRGALDELVPKSHTHANKDTLDKLSVSNGKLQYNGSDVGGIDVTGATVGQTVRIAAVDENGVPTAWEAVDFEKKWELVETGSLVGVATIERIFAVPYKNILVVMKRVTHAEGGQYGADAQKGTWTLTVNDYQYTSGYVGANAHSWGAYWTWDIEANNKIIAVKQTEPVLGENRDSVNMAAYKRLCTPIEGNGINKMLVSFSNAENLPTNGQYYIWGCKA